MLSIDLRKDAQRTMARMQQLCVDVRAHVWAVLFVLACSGHVAQARPNAADVQRLSLLHDKGSPTLRVELANSLIRLDAADAPSLIIDLILLFAEVRYADGASESALPAVEAAYHLAMVAADASRIASLDGLAGQMQFALTRTDAARDRILRALSMQRTTGRPMALARQLSAYATLLQEVDEYAAAMRMSNEASAIVEREGGPLSVVSFGVFYTHTELLRVIGNATAAVSAAEKLLKLSEQSGNREFVGVSEHALGRAHRAAGEFELAAQRFEASYRRAQEFDDPLGQFVTALDRITIAMDQSDFVAAGDWIRQIQPLRTHIDDPSLRGSFDLHQARLLALKGDSRAARQSLQRGQTVLATIHDLWHKSLIRLTEAEILASEGKSQASLQAMRDGMQLRTQSERHVLRNVVAAQGDLYRLNEREYREKQLEQESRVRELQLDAVEQRLLTQRLVVALVTLAALVAFAAAVWQLSRARRFRRRAEVDNLTGVRSRSAIDSIARAAFERAKRERKTVSILIADVDSLKAVNDSRGHAEGDQLLKQMAALIASSLRQRDDYGRWGGDEFVVILPDTDTKIAAEIAERLRLIVVDGLALQWPGIGSCSIGVATRLSDNETFAEVLARADAALYRAKLGGKNQVIFAAE